MKIYISGYVGKNITGVGRFLENALANFPAGGDEIILYLNHDLNLKINHPSLKIRRISISKNNPLLNLFWNALIFPWLAWRGRADVVFLPNVTGMLLKYRPTVAVIHDMIEFNVTGKFSWYRMLYRWQALPLMARRADKIITDSKASKTDIIKFCGVFPEKVVVVYCGVNEKFHPQPLEVVTRVRSKYQLVRKYILFLGTMDHPGKNVRSLILACQEIWKTGHEEFDLVLAGQKGYGFDKLEPLINSDKNIIWLGFVENDDLPGLYSGAEVFCFLSLYEGFGLPVVEAMACGVPVIASDRPPFPEILEGQGVLVDPLDVTAVAGAIRQGLASKSMKGEVIKYQNQLQTRFSWARTGREIWNILKTTGTEN